MSAGNGSSRLCEATLSRLNSSIQRPSYDRKKLRAQTVHVGVGGFHRAHQAVYLDNLLEGGVLSDWSECGMGILPQDAAMRDALREQDYLYTVLERSADGKAARVIGSITDFSLAPEDPQMAIERLASESTRLVSLTITEGGYFIREGTGEFEHDHPLIEHDLREPGTPRTTLGYLAAALKLRRDRDIAPFTVMSCDNLQGNGNVIRKVLLGFAELQDRTLYRWIAGNVAFPNSMVDRITPATTQADREQLQREFGINDAWPVVTEPFLQWVIEDKFCNARPPWEEAGAEIVTDVLPHELMKIRLLNASHMAMAYLGALDGCTYAHQVMQDPAFNTFIKAFMEEVTPVVPLVPGASIPAYKHSLIVRFANPTINDRIARLCSEGSAKMPKWVLPSVVELAEKRRPTKLLSLVIAAWIKYLQSPVDERGAPIEVVDARADELRRAVRQSGNDPRPFLSMKSLFGPAYFTEASFANQIEAALKSLSSIGARQTILRYTEADIQKRGLMTQKLSLSEKLGMHPQLAIGYLGLLLFMIGDGVESGFLSPYMLDLHFSQNRIALVFTLYGVAAALASWLSGVLSDLLGPSKVMWAGFVIWLGLEVPFLVLGLAHRNYAVILLCYTIRGLGYPLFAFGFLVWVTAITPQRYLATSVGWFWFARTGGLPTLGSLFASYSVTRHGPYLTLWYSVAFVALGGLIALLGIHEPRGKRALRTGDESPFRVLLSGISIIWKVPKIGLGGIVAVITTTSEFGFLLFLPIFYIHTVGFTLPQWLQILTVMFATNIFFNLFWGWVGDKIGWRTVITLVGACGCAVAALGLYYVPHIFGANYTYVMLAGIAYGATLAGFVPLGAIMATLAPQARGAALSVYNLGSGISIWLGPAIAGIFLPFIGVAGVIWIFAMMYLLAALVGAFLKTPQLKTSADTEGDFAAAH